MAQAATSEYQGGGNKSPTNPTANNRHAPPTARKTATPKQVPPERGRQKQREKMCEAHRDEVAPPASEASGTRGAGEKKPTPRKIRHKKKGRGTRGRPFDATRNEHRPETRNANPYRKPAQHTQHNTWDLQTQGAHIKNVRPSCMRPCEATSAWKVGYVSSRNELRTGYRNVGTNRKPATLSTSHRNGTSVSHPGSSPVTENPEASIGTENRSHMPSAADETKAFHTNSFPATTTVKSLPHFLSRTGLASYCLRINSGSKPRNG